MLLLLLLLPAFSGIEILTLHHPGLTSHFFRMPQPAQACHHRGLRDQTLKNCKSVEDEAYVAAKLCPISLDQGTPILSSMPGRSENTLPKI